jgi:hypothetical protein
MTIREFIDSIPSSGLYIDLLDSLAVEANRLSHDMPELAVPFTLIRDGFSGLANRWRDEPLNPNVSAAVTPRIIGAITQALERPSSEAEVELVRALNWARAYPLISGVGGGLSS